MRKYRPNVDLPTQLVADIAAAADAAGTTSSALYYHWIVEAARMSSRGYGNLLPQERRAPRGTIGAVEQARWLQSRDDYRRCKELIEAAGSSVAAVLRHAGQRYLEAGGDAVLMTWPSKSTVPVAA